MRINIRTKILLVFSIIIIICIGAIVFNFILLNSLTQKTNYIFETVDPTVDAAHDLRQSFNIDIRAVEAYGNGYIATLDETEKIVQPSEKKITVNINKIEASGIIPQEHLASLKAILVTDEEADEKVFDLRKSTKANPKEHLISPELYLAINVFDSVSSEVSKQIDQIIIQAEQHKTDDVKNLIHDIEKSRLYIMAAFVGAIGFSIIVIYITTLLLVAPIKKMRLAAVKMSEGDLAQRVSVSSRDEIEDLGNAFNQMAENIEKSQSDLQENNEELGKFQLAVENAHEHIIITDSDGKIIYANQAMEKITGYSKAEALGKTPALWGKQMAKEFYEKLWDTIKVKKLTFSGEIQNKRKNGEKYSVVAVISPILDEKGNVKFFVGIERDITAEKNTLETIERQVGERTRQLYQEKTKLQVSVDSLSLGFIITDTQSEIVNINGTAKNLLCTPESGEIHPGVYRQPGDIVEKCDIVDIEKNLKKTFDLRARVLESLKLKKPLDFKEVPFRNSFFHIMITPIIVVENDFEVIGSVVLVENVTEDKLLQRSRDEFFSIASHELRTPLTAIRGNTSMIKDFYADLLKDPQLKEMIDDIHASSVRLIEVVNDFLDSSRLELGKMQFKKEVFDIPTLVKDVLKEYLVTSSERKVQLDWFAPKDDLPLVSADRNKTKQVLINLVGNALKFTDQGSVKISATKGGHYVKVLVADTGRGISPESQPLLFRKFQQAADSIITRDATQGTGLGLYISKLIMEGMGGSIVLESSKVGVGTAFSFSILTQAAAETAAQDGLAAVQSGITVENKQK